MTRGQALRYVGWQVLDRTGPRVVACWFIGGALLLLIGQAMRQGPGLPPRPEIEKVLITLHQQLAFIFTIILAHGIVSEDRLRGYFRFYLAKPVAAPWFYGQSAALAALGMAAVSAGYVVFGGLLLGHVWAWRVVGQGVAVFALLGMLTTVASVVSSRDWLWAIVVLVVSSILRHRYPPADSTIGRVLHALLPPNHLLGTKAALTAGEWLWLGGWGIGLFALAILLLRARRFGEG